MKEIRRIVRKSQTRDSHIPLILPHGGPLFSQADMNSGIIIPVPGMPGKAFTKDYWITQVMVTGTQDMYWKLEVNLKASTLAKTSDYDSFSSGYITKIGQNVPLTVNLWCKEGTVARFLADSDLGGVAGAGNWKIFIWGYPESIKTEVKN